MKKGSTTVIVVDSDSHQRKNSIRVLGTTGYQVVEAITGQECLRLVEKILPDLILLAAELPDIDGYELCRQLKGRAGLNHIALLFLSARPATPEERTAGLEAGADGYLSRPIDAQELLAWVQAVLRRCSQTRKNNRYRRLFDHALDAILLTDHNGHYVDANPAACALLGYSRQELLQLNIGDITAPINPELAPEVWEQFITTGQLTGEYILSHKDGHPIDLIYRAVANIEPGLHLAILHDVTELKQTQEQLRRQRDQLEETVTKRTTALRTEINERQRNETLTQAILDSLSAHIAVLDKQGQITAVNRPWDKFAAENQARPGARVKAGTNYLSFYASAAENSQSDNDASRAFTGIKKVLAGRASYFEMEYPCHSPHEKRWFSMRVTPLTSQQGGAVIAHVDVTNLILAEQSLLESKQHYRTLFEQAADGIFITDPKGYYMAVNASGCSLLGYSQAELVGMHISDLIPEEDLAKTPISFADLRAGKTVFSERRLKRKDGTLIYGDISAKMLSDGRQQAILRDITERVQAQAALRQSETNFRALTENANDGIVVVQGEGNIVYANQRAAEISGYSITELLDASIKDLLHSNEFETIINRYHQRTAGLFGSGQYETRLVRKDGQNVPIEITGAPTEWWGQPAVIAITRDITQRKLIEESLKVREKTIRALLDATIESAILVDLEGTILSLNEIAAKRLGKTTEELTGMEILNYLPLDLAASRKAMGQEAVRTGRPLTFEDQRDGIYFENTIYPVLDPAGKGILIAIYARDITKQRLLEEKLHQTLALLEQRVADRTRELAAIYDVTSVLSETLELDIMLNRLLDRIMEALNCPTAGIHTFDHQAQVLRLIAIKGAPPELAVQRTTVAVGDGLAGQVMAGGQPLMSHDVSNDPRVTIRLPDSQTQRQYLGAPMRGGGNVTGVLTVMRNKDQPEFSADDVALLTTLADQVGVVVESIRLRQQARHLTVLQERERMGQDLHDAVAQSLYSLTLFSTAALQLAQAGDLDRLQSRLSDIREGAQLALKEMRLLIYQLRPERLEQLGLAGVLQQRLAAVEQRTGMKVHLRVNQVTQLAEAKETALYLIATEALNNVLKHANASSVTIEIQDEHKEGLTMAIIDDGKGFDPAMKTDGNGLANIQARADNLGADLEIRSAPGAGTQIKVSVPGAAGVE